MIARHIYSRKPNRTWAGNRFMKKWPTLLRVFEYSQPILCNAYATCFAGVLMTFLRRVEHTRYRVQAPQKSKVQLSLTYSDQQHHTCTGTSTGRHYLKLIYHSLAISRLGAFAIANSFTRKVRTLPTLSNHLSRGAHLDTSEFGGSVAQSKSQQLHHKYINSGLYFGVLLRLYLYSLETAHGTSRQGPNDEIVRHRPAPAQNACKTFLTTYCNYN